MIMALEASKSFMSICASLDDTYCSLFSKTVKFNSKDGAIESIKLLVIEAITEWMTVRSSSSSAQPLQEIILIQSAQGSEGAKMLNQLVIKPVLADLEARCKSDRPKLTYVLLSTRASERFFLPDDSNVRAGTLVSKELVSDHYDFFLVSQYCRRGTAVPNHYRVIYCDSDMQEGVLAELLYAQCFNYCNWTGSIKVPAVLQYAKKCARFHSDALERPSTKELSRAMYYI